MKLIKNPTMQNPHSHQLNSLIQLVPKHLRKLIKQGIFMLPAQSVIPDYSQKKPTYIQQIHSCSTPSSNSMHKYTSPLPISASDIAHIHQLCYGPLAEYCSLYLKQYKMGVGEVGFHGGFGILYHPGHKGLPLHRDDSLYTVNICLLNQAVGNEVIFNETTQVQMVEDMVCIHPGAVPHSTNDLISGSRVNAVIWYK